MQKRWLELRTVQDKLFFGRAKSLGIAKRGLYLSRTLLGPGESRSKIPLPGEMKYCVQKRQLGTIELKTTLHAAPVV
jgi:hypothetical protein